MLLHEKGGRVRVLLLVHGADVGGGLGCYRPGLNLEGC